MGQLKLLYPKVIPVAEEEDVLMAIHPDDPPWNIFGLPRIITNKENLERFINLYDSKYNGLTMCSGSLGAIAEMTSLTCYVTLARKAASTLYMHVMLINWR